MKSAFLAFGILILILALSLSISAVQSSKLYAIRNGLLSISDNATNVAECESTLSNCIKDFSKSKFIIELTIPSDEHDRILYLMKCSHTFLASGDASLFAAYLEQSKIYLDSMIEYCNINFRNIL